MQQKALNAYFQTQVNTTSQGELLLMLYDGALKFLKLAKQKIEEKDYAGKGMLISKAIDVISELDNSLNTQGGEITQNLHNLYFFCNTRLLKANLKMDTTFIDEVVTILTGLRDAFAQIIEPGGVEQPPLRNSLTTGPRAAAPQQNAPGAAPPPPAAGEAPNAPAGGRLSAAVNQPPGPAGLHVVQKAAPNQNRQAAGSNVYKKMASQSS